MRARTVITRLFLSTVLVVFAIATRAEDARQFVQQAVNNELAKDEADHSLWLYFETDQKGNHFIKQWVAATANGDLRRAIQIDGERLSPDEQRNRIEEYLKDPSARTKQRKSEQHDNQQAAELLELLPKAFIWANEGEKGSNTVLHFKPDPNFHAPDMEARVFAAMEGEMLVDTRQRRIASLRGRLTQDVKIFGGILGALDAGGTFDVERHQTGDNVWQITETHVHIKGHALIFRTISEQEDDVKSEFKPLPANITMEKAKTDLIAAR